LKNGTLGIIDGSCPADYGYDARLLGAITHESVLRMGVLASENALKVLRGERPLYVVNSEVYQRAK
jgi:hypothetical protein